MRELIIVGAGAVGRTLGRVLQQSGAFRVAAVISRSQDSADRASAFISEGTTLLAPAAGSDLDLARRPGAAVMIATPDRVIESVARALADGQLVDADSLVFHCSGALSSSVLAACHSRQALLASIHPLASFADPADLAQRFSGITCAAEGDAAALDLLEPAFLLAGARVMRIPTSAKALYHAGAVLASGQVAAVIGAALAAEHAAGIEPAAAVDMLAPLIRITVENVLQQGPRKAAMTGTAAAR